MGNTQSIGSSIGDLWYPDNPRRWSRAFQLEGDFRRAIDEFNEGKTEYDTDSARVKGIMEDWLQKHGYSSVAQLDMKVQSILQGEELRKWQDLKKALSANNIISDLVMAVPGMAIVAGGVGIGALVVAGVMTGPAGWAALGTVVIIAAVVGAIVLVWGIVAGDIERAKLRDAINELFQQRQNVYLQLRTLRTYSLWMAKFEIFFLDEGFSKHPEMFAKEYEDVFRPQADTSKPSHVAHELDEFDQQRHAWTNEDPSPKLNLVPAQEEEKPKRKFVLTDAEGHEHKFYAQIIEQDRNNARERCIIKDVNTNEKWIMQAEVLADMAKEQVVALNDVLFTLVKSGDASLTLERCKLSFPIVQAYA